MGLGEDNMAAVLSLLASDHGAGWFAAQHAAQDEGLPVGGLVCVARWVRASRAAGWLAWIWA